MRVNILLVLMMLSPAALAVEPPDGWRVPTARELAVEPLRSKSPAKNAEVVGDFNGDEKTDHAYLFKSTKFSGEGLFVRLSSSAGYVWKVLDQTDWGKEHPNVDLAMGVDLAKSGNYKTACAKGYWKCESGEPETLVLKSPGIWHFRFQSAASIWYWDGNINAFKRVWVSD